MASLYYKEHLLQTTTFQTDSAKALAADVSARQRRSHLSDRQSSDHAEGPAGMRTRNLSFSRMWQRPKPPDSILHRSFAAKAALAHVEDAIIVHKNQPHDS